jgi:hypothetical protein
MPQNRPACSVEGLGPTPLFTATKMLKARVGVRLFPEKSKRFWLDRYSNNR